MRQPRSSTTAINRRATSASGRFWSIAILRIAWYAWSSETLRCSITMPLAFSISLRSASRVRALAARGVVHLEARGRRLDDRRQSFGGPAVDDVGGDAAVHGPAYQIAVTFGREYDDGPRRRFRYRRQACERLVGRRRRLDDDHVWCDARDFGAQRGCVAQLRNDSVPDAHQGVAQRTVVVAVFQQQNFLHWAATSASCMPFAVYKW